MYYSYVQPSLLQHEIDQKLGEVRFDLLDFTIGELINLHKEGEIKIQPEFQRLFRWSYGQRSRLIESLLLGLPIPQIFLMQGEDGILDLVDGLQRVSSILHFVDFESVSLPEEERSPLELTGCEVIETLNGLKYEDLPRVLKLELKRKPIRAIVIRRTNSDFIRYEMFKRLNSGGEIAQPQEIRNATVRILGPEGTKFLDFLAELTCVPSFQRTTASLSDSVRDRLGLNELVLRFLACKNFRERFRGNVADWLDDYIEHILVRRSGFDYDFERQTFTELFDLIDERLGEHAFVKFKNGQPTGGLAPAYFESVTMGALESKQDLEALDARVALNRLSTLVEGNDFRANTGPGANSLPKLNKRIELVKNAFKR